LFDLHSRKGTILMISQRRALLGATLVVGFLAAGCADSGETADTPAGGDVQQQMPADHPDISGQPPSAAAGLGGTVLETMTAGGYTYARIESAQGELWAAGPVTALTVGESVVLFDPMNMGTFTSQSLDRTFEELFFVGAFQPPQAPAAITQAPVSETMNAGGYTFVEVQTEDGPLWLAGPESEISEGDLLTWQGGAVMRGFVSKSLDRTFEEILFVEALSVVR
jgi:hypothetical protein